MYPPRVPATRMGDGAAVGRAEHLVAGLGHELVPRGDVHVVEREEAHGRVLAVDLVEAGLLQLLVDADRESPGRAGRGTGHVALRHLGGRDAVEDHRVPVALRDRVAGSTRGDVGHVEVLVEQQRRLEVRVARR